MHNEKKNIKSILKKNTNNRKGKAYLFSFFFCREKDKNTSEIIIRRRRKKRESINNWTDITTYIAYSRHLTIQEINFLKKKRRTGSEFKTQDSFEKNLSDVLLKTLSFR